IFYRLLRNFQTESRPAAIAVASFMHSFVVRTGPGGDFYNDFIHTWMEYASPESLASIRRAIGPAFHERTGCHYHPMFPVFKLAAKSIAPTHQILSPKSLLMEALTGSFVDDYGMAAATGLLNIHTASWDE